MKAWHPLAILALLVLAACGASPAPTPGEGPIPPARPQALATGHAVAEATARPAFVATLSPFARPSPTPCPRGALCAAMAGEWEVRTLQADGQAGVSFDDTCQWIEFRPDGTFTYYDGCNWHFGGYALDGSGHIEAYSNTATARACSRCDSFGDLDRAPRATGQLKPLMVRNCTPIPDEAHRLPRFRDLATAGIQGKHLLLQYAGEPSRLLVLRWTGPVQEGRFPSFP